MLLGLESDLKKKYIGRQNVEAKGVTLSSKNK